MRKLLAVLLSVLMLIGILAGCGAAKAPEATAPASAAPEPTAESAPAVPEGLKDIVILYTNDAHCAVTEGTGYAGLANIKNALIAAGKTVLLVDNGDAVQGAAIGTLSKGEYLIDMMNKLGYDVATPGNHEFDYTMEQFFVLRDKADFPYISANFVDKDGKPVLDPYVVKDVNGVKIGFVGASTPKTITTSTPTYFQDGNGNYIYGFLNDATGEGVYTAIQQAVDAARADGAEYVILMAHLGIEMDCQPWTSSDVINNTTGIDAVLDGHSHSVIESELVKNKDGRDVVLTSTGAKLANIGCLTFEEGKVVTRLINDNMTDGQSMSAFIDEINSQFEELLNEVVASTDVDLTIFDPTEVDSEGKPVRIVRRMETNLGDLCADAYRALSGADVAFVNGGGVRASIPAGDITYGQIIQVHPYGNEMCVIEVTGQQILDALELGASGLPGESGGFLQVSGMTYEINMNVESTVTRDDNKMFTGVAGDRRVQNVTIGGEPLDPEATYTLASHNYMLKSAGDGYSMFEGCNLLQDSVMIDNQVLINYIRDNLGGVVGEPYANPYGEGRITIIPAA